MDQCDSDEEDYMSESFLAKCADTRPGLVPEKLAKKYQRDNKHQTLNALHRQQNKPRRILEAEERDKGLQKTLPPENKGFKLMEKMGYKPGTAIGKTGIGRTEPVPVNIKTGRSGLGEASERKRRVEDQMAMRAVMARKRLKHEHEWKQNVRAKVVSRELERDFARSQKVCEQLDSQQGITVPERKFFWPVAFLPGNKNKDDLDEDDVDEDDNADYDNHDDDNLDDDDDIGYTVDKGCNNDEEFDEDDLLAVPDKLRLLTEHLRSAYHYCVWCGTAYNDDSDMQSNCPGNSAEDHT